MPDFRQLLQTAISTLREVGFTRPGQLERELLAAHRDLSALQNSFLDLGLQASLYARERDVALALLRKTQRYIGHPQPEQATSGTPSSSAATPPPLDVAQNSKYLIENSSRWGIFSITIRDYLTPRTRLLERELGRVHAETERLGNDYLELGDHANTMAGQRDAAVSELEKAREIADSLAPPGPGLTTTGKTDSPALSPGAFAAVTHRLHQTQSEKNDIAIRLAESEDHARQLEEEQTRLLDEISALNRQLAVTENHRAADERELLSLSAELEHARRDRELADTDSEHQLDVSRKRSLELELQLAAARRRIEDLEQRLATAPRPQPAPPVSHGMPEEQAARPVRKAAGTGSRTVSDRQERPFKWAKIGTGLVFLLGLLASINRLWETGQDDFRHATVSKDLGALTTPVSGDEDAVPKQTATPAPETEIASLEAEPESPAESPKEPATKPVSPLARRAKDTLTSGTGPFLAKHRRRGGTPHSHAWLMGDGSSMAWAGQPCRDRGLTEEACERLKENMFEEGVVRLPNGVQYTVLSNGTGASPDPQDTVLVNYRGMLLDGQEFDSSQYQGSGPVRFKLDETIAGLQSALQHMEVGARWKIYIPGDLAFKKPAPYGGETLIFDVELVAINKPDSDPAETD